MLLDKKRKDINELNEQIVQLLEKRFEVCKEIGEIKRENQMDVFDSKREDQVLSKIENMSNEYPKQNIEVFKTIMKQAKNIE